VLIRDRALVDENDLQDMKGLARQFLGENLHVSDLPYRFSSWALEEPENARLWFDGGEGLGGRSCLKG
jgi:hypothetical protein